MDALYRSLRDHLAGSLQTLPDKPRENPDNALRALWYAAVGLPRSVVTAGEGELPPLDDDVGRHRLQQLIDRRLAGEPLAHLTGRAHFMGLDMLSGPAALIPRVETEQLAQAAIELLLEEPRRPAARVIDVCTGSGNLAFAIAHHVPGAAVFAADISTEALDLAEHNRRHLGLAQVDLRRGDLLEPFDGGFDGTVDLVVCAPPYILSAKVEQMAPEIAAHEPRLAFDGGPLGVTILLRLLEESPRLLRDPHYDAVRELADARGDVRVILARRA
jgi:release factor glutamine methyltransferase